ncbi:MAG: aldo/keto reductase [Acholeplasmataceae bacterium]
MFFHLPNNVLIPKIGLGTYLLTDDIVEDVILEALKVGYTHIDTAQAYQNEAGIGRAIARSMKPRESLFITSKQQYHMPLEKAKEAFFKTLEDLQTTYLDLYLIHWPNHDPSVNQETWNFFEWLYEQKYVKAIGVCNFSRYQLQELLETATIKPMVNQVELNPGFTQIPLRTYLREQEIQVMSYGPFMRGAVFEEPMLSPLKDIARLHGVTVAQVCIAWGISQGIPMIPKTQTFKRLEENYRGSQLSLSQTEIDQITTLNTGRRKYMDPENNISGKYIK